MKDESACHTIICEMIWPIFTISSDTTPDKNCPKDVTLFVAVGIVGYYY